MTPRQFNLLRGLLERPMTTPQVREKTGASNVQDLVMKTRRKFGLIIDCTMKPGVDRYGKAVEFGVYSLTSADRIMALALVEGQGAGVTSDKRRSGPPEPPHVSIDTSGHPGSTCEATAGPAAPLAPKTTRVNWRGVLVNVQESAAPVSIADQAINDPPALGGEEG